MTEILNFEIDFQNILGVNKSNLFLSDATNASVFTTITIFKSWLPKPGCITFLSLIPNP